MINWGHTLTRGLCGCWPGNEGDGTRSVDLVGMGDATFTGGVSWKGAERNNGFGKVWTFDGVDGSYVSAPLRPYHFLTAGDTNNLQFSFGCWYRTLTTGRTWLMGMADGLGGANGLGLLIDSFGSRGLIAYGVQTVGDVTVLNSVTTNADDITGEWHHGLVTFDEQKGAFLYRDGIQVGSDLSFGIWNGAPTVIRFGDAEETFWDELNGQLAMCAWWGRMLGPAEVALLYSEPFAMLNPARGGLPAAPAAPTEKGALFGTYYRRRRVLG